MFAFSLTATTRKKREGEIDGIDYYFVSDREFDEMIKKGELIEWAYVHNHRYGTPKKSIYSLIEDRKFPVMTIDVKGAMNIKKIIPSSILIFIIPPSFNLLIERLKKRGDKIEDINIRLSTAEKEMEYIDMFDYVILNDDLNNAVSDIINIVDAELKKVYRNRDKIIELKNQLKEIIKSGGVK